MFNVPLAVSAVEVPSETVPLPAWRVRLPAEVDQVEAAPAVIVIAAPEIMLMSPEAALPMTTFPVEVPVLICVLKLLLLFKLT
jgi:hypothetical protein